MSEEQAITELRVLIVDDDVDAATSFSYLLQILGCKAAVAFGATMGVRVAQLFQPNLCFVDLGMPGSDGVDTLRAIRAVDGPAAGAVFVCLTGRANADDERRCIDAGFDLFVTKPMDSKTLPEILALARERAMTAAAVVPARLPDPLSH